MSSSSTPMMLVPLRLNTPNTRRGTSLMTTSRPTGESSPKSSVATVWPRTQTKATSWTSRSVNAPPSARFSQRRTRRNEGVVP